MASVSSFDQRIAQLQDVIDDVTLPNNQPLLGPGHARMSLVKEGYLRFVDATKTNVQVTWNGYKLMRKFAALGFISGDAPTPTGRTTGTSVPPCPPRRKKVAAKVSNKIIQSKD